METQQVWLVRHGETEWSRDGRHTSSTDLELTERGRKVAESLRDRLAGRDFGLVLTSPLRRAAETARLAGRDDAVVDDRLREWEYGAFEGLTTEQIREQVPGWELWTHPAAAGGESVEQMDARMASLAERVREVEGDVLMFAHGHSLGAFTACWLGLGAANTGHFPLDTATVSVLSSKRDTPVVRQWNA